VRVMTFIGAAIVSGVQGGEATGIHVGSEIENEGVPQ